jgi:hypothetical protein
MAEYDSIFPGMGKVETPLDRRYYYEYNNYNGVIVIT